MARRKPKGKPAAYMAFNVTYEDGSVTSNRRVSTDLLDQSFGDAVLDLARTAIEDQETKSPSVPASAAPRSRLSSTPDRGRASAHSVDFPYMAAPRRYTDPATTGRTTAGTS